MVKSVLNNHAPIKTKYVRANDGPFMTKPLRKAIMVRSKLRNRYNKNRSVENEKAFKKQRNICVKLLREAKRQYYKNLDLNDLNDNRKFWKTIKPLFSGKIQSSANVTLRENDEIISNDLAVAEIFNDYFLNITSSLEIQTIEPDIILPGNIIDPVDIAIIKYSNHPSIHRINSNFEPAEKCEFMPCSRMEMLTQINNLNHKKASPINSIPAKILKSNSDILLPYLTDAFNLCLSELAFPHELKAGDITALFKKGDTFSKKNYRPITVLSAISKIFERIMYEQIMPFVECFLSPLLCGFRKGYNTQHALLRLVESSKENLDKGGSAAAFSIDLSKAFDCLNHELLIAKLNAYGMGKDALKLINSYLSHRRQRVKINGSFSSWRESLQGVPQGSVLGPLLFNVFLNDLLVVIQETDICNFADDTTLFACDSQISNVVDKLEKDALRVAKWFPENQMKVNEEKCHFLVFGGNTDTINLSIGNSSIEESNAETLLGIDFDKSLNFKSHVRTLCKKANQKLHALSRISSYMDEKKLMLTMKTFIMSQFNYCPLVWMFYDRTINNKLNRMHERALRIAGKDDKSSFQELLQKTKSVSIHKRNLQLLMVEIYKTKHNLNPSFMKQIFEDKILPYNLRNTGTLLLPKVRTTAYGVETVRFLGQRLWEKLPDALKNAKCLESFKREIKSTELQCNCRLCKVYRLFVNKVYFIV